MTLTAATSSVDETRALGAALAELARPGDVLLLCGDLGAGKTAFTQGYGRGLGVTDPITSPTFTLASRYDGRLELNHLDVYRLEQLDEVLEIGLYDLLDEERVVVIEWGDAVAPALAADFLRLTFTFGDGDDDRVLTFEPVGARWAARTRAVADAVEPWRQDRSC
jgi:tRNA threonylcarbamoyladenosine biosynthesis protein TsaE